MPLKSYQQKRQFTKTPEPKGKVGSKNKKQKLIYIIQKHAASHLHYDLRLEWHGVLKSWAVPKGPSYNPKEKRLAVEVEDHPLEYAKFEGVIPAGEYGGGTVMLWDKGTWEPLNDPKIGLAKGKLEFRLHGKKLKGIWALIRTHLKGSKPNWLLIKKKDEYANHMDDKKLLATTSVKTQRTMEEIEGKQKQANNPINLSLVKGAKKKTMPTKIMPELATLVKSPPTDKDWIYEIKFDGYRLLSFIQKGKVKLITRNGINLTDKFTQLVNALEQLPVKSAIIDGELVALDKKGITKFQLLQNALEVGATAKLGYYIFDLLYYDGYDLSNVILKERKEQLKHISKSLNPKGMIVFCEGLIGEPKSLLKKACRIGLEGLIGKRIASLYQNKRTKDWVKFKCIQRQEFVIAGFTNPEGKREYFGALLLGYYDNKGRLQYAGRVGTGFNQQLLKDIYQKMKPYIQSKSAFAKTKNIPDIKNTHWLKPHLIGEVDFKEWTNDNIVRQPSFEGLRLDKKPKEVIKENEY
jgi:bifunctional non-homologous end joining protein LigD